MQKYNGFLYATKCCNMNKWANKQIKEAQKNVAKKQINC